MADGPSQIPILVGWQHEKCSNKIDVKITEIVINGHKILRWLNGMGQDGQIVKGEAYAGNIPDIDKSNCGESSESVAVAS